MSQVGQLSGLRILVVEDEVMVAWMLEDMLGQLGCAVVAAATVAQCTAARRAERAVVAFALVWLAPDLLYNGPAWGQADSIWTFFILLSLLGFVRGRQLGGVLALGGAFAMKAQAAFFGPVALGLLLRRNPWRVLWLGLIPLVYLIVAVPTVLAGRPFAEVMLIYANQAGKYHYLSSNAASIWILVPWFPFGPGKLIGLALGAFAGVVLTAVVARSPRRDAEFTLVAAAASLALLPYVLPMMHDRYFFAYEIAALVLACVNPRYTAFAVIAQVNCLLAYVAYDLQIGYGVRLAAISNAVAIYYLLRELGPARTAARFPRAEWVHYGIAVAATALFLAVTAGDPPSAAIKVGSSIVLGGGLAITIARLLGRSLRRS